MADFMQARCRLIALNPWYGTMASMIFWYERSDMKSMAGVAFKADGKIHGYYNLRRINLLTVEQCMSLIEHEIDHIVRAHPARQANRVSLAMSANTVKVRKCQHPPGDRSEICPRCGCDEWIEEEEDIVTVWNIAADMVVNGPQNDPNIPGIGEMPLEPIWYQAPEDNMTTEEIFDWIMGNSIGYSVGMNQEGGEGGEGQGESPGEGEDEGEGSGEGDEDQKTGGQGKPQIKGNMVGGHEVWQESDLDPDTARQLVKSMVDNASKSCGNTPGHLSQAIDELSESVIPWTTLFKQHIGRSLGSRRKTYSRRNRRRDAFGLKGVSHRAMVPVTICVDTSGSISDAELNQFFTEVEHAAHKTKITVIQFDHEVQDVQKYRKGDWSKIEAKGRGGTSFQAPYNYMLENGLVGKLNIILTDGYASWPTDVGIPITWVITESNNPVPPFGEVIFMDNYIGGVPAGQRKT